MTHAIVNKEETRKLREVVEIVNVDADGTATINTPFSWNAAEDKFYLGKPSKVFEKIAKRYGIKQEDLEIELKRRAQMIYQMYKKGIVKFEQVQEMVNRYYKRPEDVLRELGVH
jgi:hypothetical protein